MSAIRSIQVINHKAGVKHRQARENLAIRAEMSKAIEHLLGFWCDLVFPFRLSRSTLLSRLQTEF